MRSGFAHIPPIGRLLTILSFSSFVSFGTMQAQAINCPSSPPTTIVVSSFCNTTIDINAVNSPATIAIEGSGGIATAGNDGVYVSSGGVVTALTNNGLISIASIGGINYGIYNAGIISTLTNRGQIESLVNQIYNDSRGTISSFTNAGTIYSLMDNSIENHGVINVLNNLDTIKTDGSYGISNFGTITSLVNSGTISSNPSDGISNSGAITSLINSGTITGSSYGIANNSLGVIQTLTNTGAITGDSNAGIYNWTGDLTHPAGSIVTLNNGQGAGSPAGALTYDGKLPTNYNIIINSPTSYGKLAVTSVTGTTTFGIYSGSTVSKSGTYVSVLSGISASNLNNVTSGSFGRASWTLSEVDLVNGIWDLMLTVFGPSTASTQQSLVNTASALQPIYTLQNSALANSFSYDCSLFGANGVCISAGGRNTSVQGANGINNTSALLIASYRLDQNNSRIGAYADQNLSMNNSGSTVQLGNNTPLIGLFGVWSQRPNYTGAEVKISAAYGQKNTIITRQVVGDSEAGSGSSQLNSQGAQAIAKYGFGVADNTVVSPYVGLRYTQNNMGGYTEGASSSVTAPLTYSALNTNATTALAGVGARHLLTPKTTIMASVGVESDTNTSNGSYYGTNSSIPGLTAVNFNPNPVRARPTAALGAYYSIEKNQQVGISGIYRQEPFQAVSTTTVIATYTIGL